METKGGPLYRKHLNKEQVINICKHLVEKNGIRSIERITGHHRDTIGRLLEDLAIHAFSVNDTLLNEIEL
ncbi:MAG: IS1 family transposase, partial [Candidatus Thermoplasmatota archaeon]|nr:IS1 family transposase [Candidatus Thermoplasmatota archaeon]